jgi:hypothetical protein
VSEADSGRDIDKEGLDGNLLWCQMELTSAPHSGCGRK